MYPSARNILFFLRESNAIEDVYGKVAIANAHAAFKYIMMYDNLSVDIIKHTHKLLMNKTDLEPKHRGVFRPIPVRIGGILKADPPLVIDSKIRNLIQTINKSTTEDSPILYHVAFEVIHPFVDGNGRIGRIIMNWQSLKKGDGKLIVITKAQVSDYYKLFRAPVK